MSFRHDTLRSAFLAQSVERQSHNLKVVSSILTESTSTFLLRQCDDEDNGCNESGVETDEFRDPHELHEADELHDQHEVHAPHEVQSN
ncbi:hypothetical protein G6F68_015175 [Rhizopus microsporus]|nr:hypothetical protein G6F68_015175 [Rhizopus microsporus]